MKCSPRSKLIPHPQQFPRSTLIWNSNQRTPSGGHPNYFLSRYRRPAWRLNSYQNQHGVIITSAWPKIRHPLWPRKVETIILRSSITHHLCDHISLQSINHFCNIKNFCAMTWLKKTSTFRRVSIIDVDSLIYFWIFVHTKRLISS